MSKISAHWKRVNFRILHENHDREPETRRDTPKDLLPNLPLLDRQITITFSGPVLPLVPI